MADVPGQLQLTSGRCFERTHVQQVYNEIASSVNDIQHKAWPNVKRFLKKLDPGMLVADVGCGNGRYLKINNNVFKIGMDVCQPLVDSSRSKGHEVAHADNLNIPFRDGLFDAVISVGVIHHFCSSRRRVRAVQELARILCPGGRVMLYVWAFEQKRRKFDSQDVLVPWHERKDLKRTDSTSSYTSSISRISSTSSVSEDDESVDLYDNEATTTWEKHDPHIQRQSTASLEDIQALSDFKANYYALDFTSPKRKASLDCKSNSSFDCKNNSPNIEGKNELVLECRKFETSLRTMSAGLLCETPATVSSNDQYNKAYIGAAECHHGSLVNLKNLDKHAGFAINGTDEDSAMTHEHTELSAYHKNGIAISNHSKNNEMVEKKANGKKHIPQCSSIDSIKKCSAQVNPFLKQDSLDKYTFNNILTLHQPDRCDSVEEEKLTHTSPVFPIGDEVPIEFRRGNVEDTNVIPVDKKNISKECNRISSMVLRTETKSDNQKERSFFSLLKSKLLKLFDDDDKNSKKILKPMPKSQSADSVLSSTDTCQSNSYLYGSSKNYFSGFSEPELTDEQRQIAAKLNFAVREFPQSSCIINHALKYCKHDTNTTQHSDSVELSDVRCDNSFSQAVVFSLDDTPAMTDNSHDYHMSQSTPNLPGMPHPTATMERPRRKSIAFDDLWQRLNREISEEEPAMLTADVLYDGYMRIDIDKINGETQNDTCEELLVNHMCLNMNDTEEKCNVNAGVDNCNVRDGSYISNNEILTGAQRQNGLCSSAKCDIEMCDNGACNSDDTHMCNMSNNTTQCGVASSQDASSYSTDKKLSNGFNYEHSSNEMLKEGNGDEVPFVSCVDEEDVPSTNLSRYYHVFKEGELEELISSHVTDLHVVQSFYDHANWCVIAEKL